MVKITVALFATSDNDAAMEQTPEMLPDSSVALPLPDAASNAPTTENDNAVNETLTMQRRARGRKAAQARWTKANSASAVGNTPSKRRNAKSVDAPAAPKRKIRREARVFNIALTAAEKRLAKAIDERARAAATWAVLNAEIPSLQRTIAALRNQQNPDAFVQNYQMPLPDGSTGNYTSNANYMAQVVSDAPMPPTAPPPGVSPRALAATRARGGAVDVELEESADDEDKFLNASGMAGGNWH